MYPERDSAAEKDFCVSEKTLVKSCLEMLAEIECDEGHELMLQGNDSVSVAMDVENKTNEVRKRERE